MTKRKTGVDMNPRNAGESSLKGLERRTHQGRRKTPRRKSDPKAGATPAVPEPEHLLTLTGEADALVTHCYEELFSLFPEVLSVFRDSNADDRHRKLTAAMGLIVNVLHRQDERVKALKVLEMDNCAAIAETLLDLMNDFSSSAWTGAFEQIRDVSGQRETKGR